MKKNVSVRVDAEALRRALARARLEGLSLSTVVERFFKDYGEREGIGHLTLREQIYR